MKIVTWLVILIIQGGYETIKSIRSASHGIEDMTESWGIAKCIHADVRRGLWPNTSTGHLPFPNGL